MDMNENALKLWQELKALSEYLRDQTRKKYKRINPFYEDLFDWKERGKYWLGEDKGVTIYNSTTVVGDVKIGKGTWIGPFCSLDGTGGLTIGNFCSISLGCQLLTHDTVKWALSGGKAAYEYAPTKIGNCCFIGVNSTILRGTTIGNHCLIGACSLVNRDIPDNSIAVGIPARIIGRVELDGNEVIFNYHSIDK